VSHIRIAYALILETFQAILGNWNMAIRSMAMPLIAPILGIAVLAFGIGATGQILPNGRIAIGGGAFALLLVLLCFLAIGPIAVAIRWHRFGLLGTVPRWGLEITKWGPGFGYFGRILLVGLCSLLILLILMFPSYLLIDKGMNGFRIAIGQIPEPFTLKNLVISSIAAAITTAFFLKLAIILPAAAIGRNIRLVEALRASETYHFIVYVTLGLFLHLAPMLLNAVLSELPLNNLSSLMIAPFLMAMWFMFGIGLLTTIYAHCFRSQTA
jgi:hypothetical protein